MRMVLAVVLLSLLLTGSIYQTYEQKVDINGNSVITREEDANLFLGMLGDDAGQKIEIACGADASLGCTYSEGRLKLTESFRPGDGYYEFEVVHGLPYVEYQLEVNRIPTDRFMEKLSEILVAAGLSNTTTQNGRALDLSNAGENAEMAKLMRDSQLDIVYIVEMPGEVVVGSAGGAGAELTCSTATFSLADVLSESRPMVVKSRELNIAYIIFILAVLVIAAFAASFFFGKKKKR